MQERIDSTGIAQEKPERTRRSYTREFKRQIVTMCREDDRSIAKVAMEHQINANLIHKWCKQLSNVEPQAMLPVAVQSASDPHSRIELTVGDCTVRFFGSEGQHSAIAVLKALR